MFETNVTITYNIKIQSISDETVLHTLDFIRWLEAKAIEIGAGETGMHTIYYLKDENYKNDVVVVVYITANEHE